MQKSLMKLLGMAVLTWSSQASAVSMGAINVSSALGQPLQAKIGLESVSTEEKVDLLAKLASPEAYKIAGLEYPSGINFKFTLSDDGKTIVVTSDQPISVPFVSLLVELTWATGKLQRDFTFLVDPVGYNPEQPKPAEAQPVAPQAGDSANPAPVERQTLVEKTPTPKGKKSAAPANTESAGTVTVHRGDTLSKVAANARPADVSLERMIVAMYRVNADRFTGSNMNRVKAGTILRVPTQDEINGVTQNTAKQEIQVQTKDWQAYRQRLAGAVVQPTEKTDTAAPSTNQSSSGKVGSAVADKAAAAPANPNGMLKLSTGDAPTDKAATAQDRKNAKVEDQIAQSKAAQEAQARAAAAAKNAADAQHLIELKADLVKQASAATAAPAIAANPVSGVASAVAALAGSAVTSGVPGSDIEEIGAISMPRPASVPAPAKPATPPAAAEGSLMDDAMALVQPAVQAVEGIDPLYVVGGLGGLAALGGAAYFINRRRKQQAEAADETPSFASAFTRDEDEDDNALSMAGDNARQEDIEETSSNIPPMYPGQNTGSYHTPLQDDAEDEEDPIEEARLFLSFGRDVQAEDILKDALKKTPNNHLVHLELLSIYANRKDVNAFAAVAHQLKDSGDENVWAQAAALGRKLEPGNSLYLADGEAPVADSQKVAAFSAAPPAAAPMLDFDIGTFTSKTPVVTPQQGGGTGLDINVAGATSENPAMRGDSTGSAAVFDVTSMHPTIPPTQAFKANTNVSMDFTMPEIPAMAPAVESTANLPEGLPMMDMQFNVELTMPPSKTAPAPAESTASFSTGGIQFAMPGELTSSSAAVAADPLSNFSTGNIGFATADAPTPAPAVAADPLVFPSGDLGFALPDIGLPASNDNTAASIDSLFSTPATGSSDAGSSTLPDFDSLFASNTSKTAAVSTLSATSNFSTAGVDFAVPDIAALTSSMPALDLPPLPDVGSLTGSSSMKLDFGGLNLNIGGETSNVPIGENTAAQSVGNKLDLARVYIEMDDPQSAKELLEEVAREGSPDQVAEAQAMLKKI